MRVLLCVLQCGVYLRTLAAQGTLVQGPMHDVLHLIVLLVCLHSTSCYPTFRRSCSL